MRNTLTILDKAEGAGEIRTALAAIREARGNVELLARLLGEVKTESRVGILISTEWTMIRAALMEALTPYPEASTAVAERLLELEAG